MAIKIAVFLLKCKWIIESNNVLVFLCVRRGLHVLMLMYIGIHVFACKRIAVTQRVCVRVRIKHIATSA